MIAEAAAIISAIKAANDAYKTITTAKGNASAIISGAAKFLDAKQKVDVQAAEDKAKGQTSTEAFIASIELTRRQKELDDFFTYECEGWVGKAWNDHKASMRKQSKDEIFAAKQKGRTIKNSLPEDDTMLLGIKILTGFCVVLIMAMVTAVGLKMVQ